MERLSEIYKIIGQNMINALPLDSWVKAELEIRAGTDFAEYSGVYFDSENEIYDMDVHGFSDEIGFVLVELFNLTTKNKNYWSSGKFILYPNYEFDLKFEY